jgi:hypothetical protein
MRNNILKHLFATSLILLVHMKIPDVLVSIRNPILLGYMQRPGLHACKEVLSLWGGILYEFLSNCPSDGHNGYHLYASSVTTLWEVTLHYLCARSHKLSNSWQKCQKVIHVFTKYMTNRGTYRSSQNSHQKCTWKIPLSMSKNITWICCLGPNYVTITLTVVEI